MSRHSCGLYLVICMVVSAFVPSRALGDANGPPNVILILTDDQGYGDFSCHGNPIVETPHIDELAAASVRLTDFHVAPMCTPTRGQLLTGLDAFRNGAINVSSGRTLLRPELTTIADHFAGAGYATGMFGKWHLGDNYPFRPHDRGFREAIWFPSSHINSVPDFWNNDYFDDIYLHRSERKPFPGYCTDVFFDQAKSWIDGLTEDQPFFAYIPLNAAHWPLFVPEHYREPVRRWMAESPRQVSHLSPERREALVSFLAMGVNIDENVGEMDAFLRDRNLLENTVVVFMTDNGSTMGRDYFNAGMRGKKTELWEGGHRVPCFIRGPTEHLGPPREIRTLTHVQDLMPTLMDLADIDLPNAAELDGRSLLPLLDGDDESFSERMLVINYSRMPGMKVGYTDENPAIPQRDGAAVLWKHWRLLENRSLYNVAEDPHQDHDVSAEHPAVVAAMRKHLEAWWDSVKDDVFEPQRVIIGNDAENPMTLTACEWLDVFVDQQRQIRRADRKNGTWHLQVEHDGDYRFELRRWPRESQLRLADASEAYVGVDGTYAAGVPLPIAAASLRIHDRVIELDRMSLDGTHFATDQALSAGDCEVRATFLDANGQEVCGAYYLYVDRR